MSKYIIKLLEKSSSLDNYLSIFLHNSVKYFTIPASAIQIYLKFRE